MKSAAKKGFIIFNDKKLEQIVFNDRLLEDGTLKRIYSSSSTLIDLTYYINPISEKAIFYLNSNKLPKIYKKDNDGNDILSERLSIIKKVLNYDDKQTKRTDMQNKFPQKDIPDKR